MDCQHYDREYLIISPCCQREYSCRLCHDENEDHQIDRHAIETIKCLTCLKVVPFSQNCENCQLEFGSYCCHICKFISDEDIFHCDKCQICRKGKSEDYFHCDTCGQCLNILIRDEHTCLPDASKTDCPICLDSMYRTVKEVMVLRCGHRIHKECLDEYVKHDYRCPMCKQSLSKEMNWEMFDQQIEQVPMPEEYQDTQADIFCQDCQQESTVSYHFLGHGCAACGSYNTSVNGLINVPNRN